MPGRFFRLDAERRVVECGSAQEWFDNVLIHNREVAVTRVGEHLISTMFWGVAHSDVPGPPLVFETRVFPECGRPELASSYEEALAVHARMVAELSGR